MPPFFSVIIPVYNCGHLIVETLESALTQEYEDFEIIIVNDGSTDDTRDVLEAYSKRYYPRIKVINQENKGEGGARNSGIQHSAGGYVALLDQDDLWFPWTLQTYHKVLENNGYPAILIGTGEEFNDASAVKSIKFRPLSVNYYEDYFSLAMHPYIPAGTPGTVVRASEARRVGGLSMARVVGIDQEFLFKLGDARGLVYVLSPTTVAIRRHSANLQRNIDMTAKGALFLINGELENRYPGGNQRKWSRRMMISRMVRTMSVQCLKAKYFRQGWEIYFRTFKWNLRLGRLKYLLGFPLKYAFEKVRKTWEERKRLVFF
jgi:glycosyltransferase involved in cell wall biosynthesis